MRKIAYLLILLAIILNCVSATAKTTLSKSQKKTADKIAEITEKNWKKRGVLPSVAVTQAFIESSLGKNQVKPNNLWGIRPGGVHYSSYDSLKDGTNAYLRVINNGRYDKALYKKDYRKQLKHILDGGYYGEDDGGTKEKYYRNCIISIEKHGFDKYDKHLFRSLQEKAARKQKKKAALCERR